MDVLRSVSDIVVVVDIRKEIKVKVLLTSGGTKTYIDEVRHIGNMSSGTFGNHICNAFLKDGHDVTFLYAEGSKCPHKVSVDLRVENDCESKFNEALSFFKKHKTQYLEYPYKDFESYAENLRGLLLNEYDIVILCAAVSDYAPIKSAGKISSELDVLTIHMEKTPKLIREAKKLNSNAFLVGFKLLVDSTEEQLQQAMEKQMDIANSDMVVGNDLRDIKANNHTLRLLFKNKQIKTFSNYGGSELAELLVKEIIGQVKGKLA